MIVLYWLLFGIIVSLFIGRVIYLNTTKQGVKKDVKDDCN